MYTQIQASWFTSLLEPTISLWQTYILPFLKNFDAYNIYNSTWGSPQWAEMQTRKLRRTKCLDLDCFLTCVHPDRNDRVCTNPALNNEVRHPDLLIHPIFPLFEEGLLPVTGKDKKPLLPVNPCPHYPESIKIHSPVLWNVLICLTNVPLCYGTTLVLGGFRIQPSKNADRVRVNN